jgi:hypothetical protein
VRTTIAHAAAGLIADGLTDYHAAKLKAARQFGVTDRKSLPDNREIESALREHLALFQRESQPRALQVLRETALEAMHWLERFSPWLTGSVLNGTANEFSDIELELIGVDAKTFELFLLNEGMEFHTRELRDRDQSPRSVQYELEFDEIALVVTLFESHSQRAMLIPRESVKSERLQLAAAQAQFN